MTPGRRLRGVRAAPSRRPGLGPLPFLLCLLACLAGCASRPVAPPGHDGPGPNPPPGLERTPDARPRIEPLRSGGPNKPYEAMGQRYVPLTDDLPYRETGGASWYGRKFHGLPTASGEPYDMYAMTAAHRTLPIPSYALVRNPANGREVIVRINDRGPFSPGRVIDLSYTAALKLGVLGGVAPVELQRLTFDDIRAGRFGSPAARTATAALAPAALAPAARAAVAPTGVAPTGVAPDDGVPGDAAPAAAGWWVQLGAFRSREPAAQLAQRALRELGELSAVAVFDDAGWYRVQAGPWASRTQALDMAGLVQRQLGIAALAVERAARP